jgi:hypothetical protein
MIEVIRNYVTVKGQVIFGVKTKKVDLTIYVTKTGLVRIFDENGEWRPGMQQPIVGKDYLY